MLVKFVVVTMSGSTWLYMATRYRDANAVSRRTPDTRVERWTFPVLPDGTHGDPDKVRCHPQGQDGKFEGKP